MTACSHRSRNGSVLLALLLAAGAAATLAFAIIAGAAQRSHQAQLNLARIQGREWCLGARLLPPGTTFTSGDWRIAVDGQRAVTASDPRGTYRIAADGRESWGRTP